MSLNWDVTACQPPANFDNPGDTNRLDSLIWGALYVDIGTITNANIGEWVWRVEFLRRSLGDGRSPFTLRYADGREQKLHRADLRRWVGLRTNVTTTSRKKFIKKIMDQMVNQVNAIVAEKMKEEE